MSRNTAPGSGNSGARGHRAWTIQSFSSWFPHRNDFAAICVPSSALKGLSQSPRVTNSKPNREQCRAASHQCQHCHMMISGAERPLKSEKPWSDCLWGFYFQGRGLLDSQPGLSRAENASGRGKKCHRLAGSCLPLQGPEVDPSHQASQPGRAANFTGGIAPAALLGKTLGFCWCTRESCSAGAPSTTGDVSVSRGPALMPSCVAGNEFTLYSVLSIPAGLAAHRRGGDAAICSSTPWCL